MNRMSPQTLRRPIVVFLALMLASLIMPKAGLAQDTIPKEAISGLKAPVIADFEELKTKFVQLAGAFPDDKMAWRPMEGVRSVGEVLALIALEFNGAVPQGWAGTAQQSRDQMLALRTSTNKAELIGAINKAYDYAMAQIKAADAAALTGKRPGTNGQQRSLYEFILTINGDMHEHLGQLVAYARMNKIVPPWSK